MRPQDCRRWQRLWCKRCGRSGRPARLLTGRDAAETLSSAAIVDSSAASALPPEVCSALAMRLSNACTPLSTEATPRAHRRYPTLFRSQDDTRCTVSTATASRRRGPWWNGEPPCARGAGIHRSGSKTVTSFSKRGAVTSSRCKTAQRWERQQKGANGALHTPKLRLRNPAARLRGLPSLSACPVATARSPRVARAARTVRVTLLPSWCR